MVAVAPVPEASVKPEIAAVARPYGGLDWLDESTVRVRTFPPPGASWSANQCRRIAVDVALCAAEHVVTGRIEAEPIAVAVHDRHPYATGSVEVTASVLRVGPTMAVVSVDIRSHDNRLSDVVVSVARARR